MSDLLIHSMSEFSSIIIDCLTAAGTRNIVEVGAEFGGMSQHLGDFVTAAGGMLTSIDPAPKAAFTTWSQAHPRSRHIASTSLEAIPTLLDIDAWVIDGDHNYYTVNSELHAIDAVGRRDGRPLLAFLHDVCWPCGRRDFYYAPDQIPQTYLHQYDYEGGVHIDHDGVTPGRGFRGNGSFAVATHSGGPRNGVLTAVDDFIAEASAGGRELAWGFIPAVFGLGILFDVTAPWSGRIAELILPYHNNPLLASLERNRLANYLKVLDYQDRRAG